jgi:hypothetical protein
MVEYITEDSCAPLAPSNDGKLTKYNSCHRSSAVVKIQ